MQRRDPDDVGGERTQLTQFLDYQPATVLMKAEGVDRTQMNMTTAA